MVREWDRGEQRESNADLSQQGVDLATVIHDVQSATVSWEGGYRVRTPIFRRPFRRHEAPNHISFHMTTDQMSNAPYKIKFERHRDNSRAHIFALHIRRNDEIVYDTSEREEPFDEKRAAIEIRKRGYDRVDDTTARTYLAEIHDLLGKQWPADLDHSVLASATHQSSSPLTPETLEEFRTLIDSLVTERRRVSKWFEGDQEYTLTTVDGFNQNQGHTQLQTSLFDTGPDGALIEKVKTWHFIKGRTPYLTEHELKNNPTITPEIVEDEVSVRQLYMKNEKISSNMSYNQSREAVSQGLHILGRLRESLGISQEPSGPVTLELGTQSQEKDITQDNPDDMKPLGIEFGQEESPPEQRFKHKNSYGVDFDDGDGFAIPLDDIDKNNGNDQEGPEVER